MQLQCSGVFTCMQTVIVCNWIHDVYEPKTTVWECTRTMITYQQFDTTSISMYSKSYAYTEREEMNGLLDELFPDNDETTLDPDAQQTQLSLSPIVNTAGYTYANVSLPPSQQSSPVSLNTAFQAHQPSLPMESAMESGTMTEYCQTDAAKTDMSPERAIALKSMYNKLIRDLYDLSTSGAITESEYIQAAEGHYFRTDVNLVTDCIYASFPILTRLIIMYLRCFPCYAICIWHRSQCMCTSSKLAIKIALKTIYIHLEEMHVLKINQLHCTVTKGDNIKNTIILLQ